MRTKVVFLKGMALLLLSAFASCSSLMTPEHAENLSVLSFVYDVTFKDACQEKSDNPSLDDLSRIFKIAYGVSSLSDEEKGACVRVVETEWDDTGDDYDVYAVIYEVDLSEELGIGRRYALVALTEFDNGRIEWEVLAVEPSLVRVKSYLE